MQHDGPVCLPVHYNAMDVSTTTVTVSTSILLLEVRPKTFTLDLSMSIKLVRRNSRIKLARGYVNMDQRFMDKVWKPDMYIWNLSGGSDKITSFTVSNQGGDVTIT